MKIKISNDSKRDTYFLLVKPFDETDKVTAGYEVTKQELYELYSKLKAVFKDEEK